MFWNQLCDLLVLFRSSSLGKGELQMRVLLPIDEQPYIDAQVDFALNYCWPKDTEIKILHVMHSVMIERTMVSSQIYIDQIMKDARKNATKAADEVCKKLETGLSAVKVSKDLIEGDAVHEIIHFAQQWQADMIVMGSHGREGIGRVVLGSVAYSVMAKAPCQTLILGLPHIEKEYEDSWKKAPIALRLKH